MPDFVTVQVQGLAEVDAKLHKLANKLADRSLRKAVEAGLVVMADAVRDRTPEKTGLLKSSVGGRVATSQKQGALVGVVGFGNEGYVARLVEFGHRVRAKAKNGKSKKSGAVVGHVPAHPFMRPAFDESKDAAVEAFTETIKSEVESGI